MTDQVVAEIESMYRRRLFDRAVRAGREAIEQGGASMGARRAAEIHAWVGLSAIEQGFDELAVTSLTVAHEWDPVDRQVGLALGRLLLRLERDAEAWDVLEGTLLHHADDMKPSALAVVTATLAESYLRGGEAGAALARVRAARAVAPTDARLLDLEADALEALGRHDEAVGARWERVDRETEPEQRARAAVPLCGLLMSLERAEDAADVARQVAAEIEAILAHRPTAMRTWEALVQVLGAAALWRDALAAHVQAATRLEAGDAASQAIAAHVWRMAGDLATRQLGDDSEGRAAYARADALKAVVDDDALLRPTGMYADVSPVDELWTQVVQRPGDLGVTEEYGRALVASGATAYGELVLRVVVAQGGGSPELRTEFRPRTWTPRRFLRPLTDDARTRWLRPQARRAALDALFHIAFHVVGGIFAHTLRDHGLLARDRLAVTDTLPAIRAFVEVSADLGFTQPPALYADRRGQGASSAFMLEPSFILGADVLAAEDSPSIRFLAAQLLTMAQPRFALAGMLATGHLLAVVKAMTDLELPGGDRCDAALVARVREAGRAAMTPEWEAPLSDVIRRLQSGAALPRIHEWAALVSAEAARTGLLVANDIDAALDASGRFGVLREPERLDQRRIDLALYAVSPSFHRALDEIGTEPAGS